MVLQTYIQDWAARLARLRQAAAEQPEGPAWLWAIRIRILKFMLSRYADAPTERARGTRAEVEREEAVPTPAARPSGAPPIVRITTEEGPSLHRPAPVPFAGVDAPPKLREAFSPVLEKLNAINTDLRVALGHDPTPDIAWQWWRDAYGVRR